MWTRAGGTEGPAGSRRAPARNMHTCLLRSGSHPATQAVLGSKLPPEAGKACSGTDIMLAVESIITTHGKTFTVDTEGVEEMISTEQYQMYKTVLESIRPTFDAAASLFVEQTIATREMLEMSKDLFYAAQALGDSSIPAFNPPIPSTKGLPRSLSNFYKSMMPSNHGDGHTVERFSHPNAVPEKPGKQGRLNSSVGGSSVSGSSDENFLHHKSIGNSVSTEQPRPPVGRGGMMRRMSRAVSQMLSGMSRGSARRAPEQATAAEQQGLLAVTVDAPRAEITPVRAQSPNRDGPV